MQSIFSNPNKNVETYFSDFFSNNFCDNLNVKNDFEICAINKSNSKRPFLNIFSEGVEGSWLYDTGADVSVISNTLFQKLKNKPKLTKHLGNLNSAGNTKLGVLGNCNLNLKVLGKNFDQKVFVCENLRARMIRSTTA